MADPSTPPTETAIDTRPAIAVLPFANLNDDPAQGLFSDGVAADIISELSRWRLLSVRSRSASFRYRSAAIDMREVAHDLDVRYLLEGSVRRIGGRLRITAQLIDADSGSHLWEEQFDRPQQDLFAVQDEVVRTIVGTLVGRVQADAAQRAARKPPASLAAYECVLRGNALPWGDAAAAAEAARLFEQAIALDPGYGLPHALLAVLRYGAWFEALHGRDELLDEALLLAERGVALNPSESTCHSMLGMVHMHRHDWELGQRSVERSLQLNPGNQWNLADMGMVQVCLGKPEAALDWLARAVAVDPYFDPAWFWRTRGHALLLLERPAEALAALERASVRSWRILALMAASHALLGEREAAAARLQDCLALKPELTCAAYLSREPLRREQDRQLQARALALAGLPA